MGCAAGATVLVAGLGDLGGRSLELLGGNPRIHRLVGSGSAGERSTALVAQTALVADTLGGAAHVDIAPVDLSDQSSVERLLRTTAPDVVVFAASRHSWWRTPPPARALPYGVWLPLQVSLLRTFMCAHRAVGSTATVVALAHPDVAGPVLAAEGLAPHTGAGNVAEVAAKLRVLVAAERGCPRDAVDVRLVLHHAAERLAFALFDPAARTGGGPADAGPPYLVRVSVHGTPLPDDEVDRLLRRPYPLPGGTGSHQLTAATVAQLVDALLDDEPRRLHVPAPAGLPGGYPVTVSRAGLELDLPDGVDLAAAVAVNEQAATYDGIAAVDADGTVHWTDEAVEQAARVLGVTLSPVPPAGLDRLADELARALRRLA